MSQALDPVLQVALDVPLPRLFDYRGDAGIVPGSLVRVPFGRTQNGKSAKTGVVVAVAAQSEQPADKLKAIEAVLAVEPLPPDWLALCEFVSRYYQHPLGGVVNMALPPLLRQGKLPRRTKERAAPAGTVPPARTAGSTLGVPTFRICCPNRRRRWRPSTRPRASRLSCCMASPAAARPRSTCVPSPPCSNAAARP